MGKESAMSNSSPRKQVGYWSRPGRIKQTFETRRWGRVGETGSPAHSDKIAICRSSNA